jgi:hypothetical protein
MGLSSFNRMRRERAAVEKIEAERFKIDNEARNAARLDKEKARSDATDLLEKAEAAEIAATEAIAEKNRRGQQPGADDLPLRKDHAAEIAGRNIEGAQKPKDPVDRIDERIPQGETANEKLVEHMSVAGEGPSPELLEAAQKEAGALPDAANADEDVAQKGTTGRVRVPETDDSRAAVNIPDNWGELSWQERRSIASQVSADPITNGEQANAAIEAELKRRS